MQSHSLCGIRPLLEIAEGGRRDDQGRFLQRTWLPSPCRSNETPRFPAFSRLSSSTSLIHELVKGWRDNDTPGPLRPRRVGHGWGGACCGYRPLAALCARRVFRGNEAHTCHQCSWTLTTRQVSHVGHQDDSHAALHLCLRKQARYQEPFLQATCKLVVVHTHPPALPNQLSRDLRPKAPRRGSGDLPRHAGDA